MISAGLMSIEVWCLEVAKYDNDEGGGESWGGAVAGEKEKRNWDFFFLFLSL